MDNPEKTATKDEEKNKKNTQHNMCRAPQTQIM